MFQYFSKNVLKYLSMLELEENILIFDPHLRVNRNGASEALNLPRVAVQWLIVDK